VLGGLFGENLDIVLRSLAPDYGLLLDVGRIKEARSDDSLKVTLSHALRTGLAALRNAISEGYRAFVLTRVSDMGSFVENELALSLKATEPALALVPFEGYVLAENYIGYRVVSRNVLVLFVLAALPRCGELTGASPITAKGSKGLLYAFRSAGAGGPTVTWKHVGDILARILPDHASQPSAKVVVSKVSDFSDSLG
jgi:hypothetical protein